MSSTESKGRGALVLKTDSKIEPRAKAGTVVYLCRGYDYGCASDDTFFTGIEHISVTLDAEGGYPFFTHPKADLDALQARATGESSK